MEGSQHGGVFLSMTTCCSDSRLLTTFWLDLMTVGTPFTVTLISVTGSVTGLNLVVWIMRSFIGHGQSRLFHVEHNMIRQLFLSSQRRW